MKKVYAYNFFQHIFSKNCYSCIISSWNFASSCDYDQCILKENSAYFFSSIRLYSSRLKVCQTLGFTGCLKLWKTCLKKLQEGSLSSVAVFQLICFGNVLLNLVQNIVLLDYLVFCHYCSAGFVLIAHSGTEDGPVAERLPGNQDAFSLVI